MQFLALQTNLSVIKAQFLGEDEKEVLTAHYHIFRFLPVTLEQAAVAFVVLAGGTVAAYFGVSIWLLTLILFVWAGVCVARLVAAYIGWRFSFILITTRKVVNVEQTIFKQKTSTMNFENISSVIGATQWGNIFNFGKVILMLKQPSNTRMTIDYVADHQTCVSRVTDLSANFQPMVAPGEMTGPEAKSPDTEKPQGHHTIYPSSSGSSDSGSSGPASYSAAVESSSSYSSGE